MIPVFPYITRSKLAIIWIAICVQIWKIMTCHYKIRVLIWTLKSSKIKSIFMTQEASTNQQYINVSMFRVSVPRRARRLTVTWYNCGGGPGRIVVLNSPKVGTSNMAPAVGLVPVRASLILYPWKNKLVIITLNYSHRKNVIYSDYDKIPNMGGQTPAISKIFVIVVTYISNMVTLTRSYKI